MPNSKKSKKGGDQQHVTIVPVEPVKGKLISIFKNI